MQFENRAGKRRESPTFIHYAMFFFCFLSVVLGALSYLQFQQLQNFQRERASGQQFLQETSVRMSSETDELRAEHNGRPVDADEADVELVD